MIPNYIEEYLMFLRKSRSDNSSETIEETLARHEKELQELAVKTLGHEIEEKNIYREVVSGGEDLESRPEFLKLLKRLEAGNIKGVLVVDTQRLSRSGIYGAGDVINAFLYTHTLIITPMKTYDLNNKYDKKFIEMELLQGAEYLEYTKQILANGRTRSLKEGKFIGSETPYGYDKEKIKGEKGYKLIINQEEAEIVKMIYDIYTEEDIGTVTIANQLNNENIRTRNNGYFNPDYVRSILNDPTYYGMLTWEKRKNVKVLVDGKIEKKTKTNKQPIIVKGLHEPIISKEQFDLAQQKMKSHNSSKVPRNSELKNPLAGLIKCGKCNFAIIMKKPSGARSLVERRVHKLDKQKLNNLLRTKKEENKLSLTQIAVALNIKKAQVDSWFSKDIKRAYYSKFFASYWYQLKELLNITTDEFDKAITEYEYSRLGNIVECRNPRCDNVSSYHHLVEERVLHSLKLKFDDYRYFLDNYEQVIVKEKKSNLKALERITADIEKLNRRLKNAKKFYELEDYTREEYLETKKEVEDELKILNAKKEELEKDEQEEKLIQYKKAIPILADCIKRYDELNITDKNDLLKSIIEKIVYTKAERSYRGIDTTDNVTLEIFYRI